jgi:uncharacterized protein (TIGR02271 family)
MSYEEYEMTTITLTAIFDSAADARRAQESLMSLGLRADDVRVVNQESNDEPDTGGKGLWESIKDFFIPDDDRDTYMEGVRRGGYLLTARVEESLADEACRTLENSDAVDLEQRTEQWRSEGWQSDVGRSPAVSAQEPRPLNETEEAIPVVRERLQVGKREVERGGVRVRSYVVEEPVSEEIALREERVDVERRPVNRRLEGTAEDMLRDRTIDVTETVEEPVVAKEAEVTEEVVVRKFEGHRTEGVSDTVRHTEVDVEDTRDSPPPRGGQKRGEAPSKRPSR